MVVFSITTQAQVILDTQKASLSEWQSKSFSGETQYQWKNSDGERYLQAISESSASGIAKEQRIDLLQTPFLNWSWSTESLLSSLNETKKSGDDYVARIYVVIDGGWQFWSTISLNYVYSSQQTVGQTWNNAFAGENVVMLAVQGKESAPRTWYANKRNVYQDLIRYFGDKGSDEKNQEAYRYIDAVAIMTDTDNSEQKATSQYGNIWFSKD
ncbi:DUF3047 domain-containing protein [Bermanella marisrubri]|uniref:DUF3047 domain-containing protein n=2 Tax=Bermanella marisrubri TaxID=207949 RepID=Q1MYS9_9GAMM|nr:hypothetical protein RED65_05014 [Oceanobacter sp. RED65] [Bermanella marisrubri]QIZ85752.1 DUF3047 domain-containing protein [Bermanella marisrubri]